MQKMFDKYLGLTDLIAMLHDQSHVGGIGIKDFLTNDFRNKLLEEAKTVVYEPQPFKLKTNVIQDLESYTLKEEDIKFEFALTLKREYEKLISGIFERQYQSQIVFQHYKKGSVGITPHRDYLRDRNIISVFVLDGAAKFYICQGRTKKGAIELESSPGSLILLRAPRNENELAIRPVHYLDKVTQERYSLALRQVNQ